MLNIISRYLLLFFVPQGYNEYSYILKVILFAGHSVGELGCAYADGCLTAEEMILASYYRGLVSAQTPFIRGAMAAVGLGYKQVIFLTYFIFHVT